MTFLRLPRLGDRRPFFPPTGIPALIALAMTLALAGCLFDSQNIIPESKYRTGLLDTLVSVNRPAARTVHLFQPLRDPSLAGKAPAKAESFAPVHVKDFAANEVVAYTLTRQRFGDWTPELELKWNYFLLQVYFLFPKSIPDSAPSAGGTKALYDAINKADKFSHYYDSASAGAAMDRITQTTRPGALGIEVSLNETEDSVVVRRVVPTSPAGRAGFAKGMIILAVDDSATVGDSAIERFSRFSTGDSGKASTLTLLTPQGIKSFRLVREPVAFPTVYADSIGGMGYIAITSFMPKTIGTQTTATEFKTALAATKRFPVTILDLRDNGGGSLDLTTKMCDEILPAGEVIIRQEQRQFSEEDHVPLVSMVHHLATSTGSAERRKFVLMGNRSSASASEIFLVALMEGAKAPMVGQKTYGKGVGQNVRNTPGKGLALVTFLKFTSQGGLDYHTHGIEPTVADSATGDKLLMRAVEVAKAQASGKAAKVGATVALDERLTDRARLLEWNRRQAFRPGVDELDAPFLP